MLSDLAPPRNTYLPAAPLELVIWQLQLAEAAEIADARVGTGLAERLSQEGGSFQLARLAAPTSIAIALGPGPHAMQPEPQQMDGWQLRRDHHVITINRGAITIETTDYENWQALRSLIEAVLDGLASLISMPSEQRLGLRHVDRVLKSDVVHASDWRRWLAPWLAGPLSHPQLGESVQAFAQQVDFDAGDGVQATLRQRAFADPEQRGRQTVMLDFDVFRDGYRLFDPQTILDASDTLNMVSHQLFDASISDELYESFSQED